LIFDRDIRRLAKVAARLERRSMPSRTTARAAVSKPAAR
jgi:hypothetical protein